MTTKPSPEEIATQAADECLGLGVEDSSVIGEYIVKALTDAGYVIVDREPTNEEWKNAGIKLPCPEFLHDECSGLGCGGCNGTGFVPLTQQDTTP